MGFRAAACGFALLVSGCSDDGSAGAGAGGSPSCEPGRECTAVGIQGCAAMFIEEDGVCRPSDDKCPPGTIPKFSEGCIVVGIPNCAPEFVEADGHCYPLPEKCPTATFPLPTEGCVPIDGDEGCGSGTWGPIVDAPGTVWVDASYAGGDSDGSPLKPVTTVAAALALVAPGGRIALAAGNYAEALALDVPVEIVGRCPSLVQLSGAAPTAYGFDATVLVDDARGVALRRLRIGGGGIGVIAATSDVELDGVHLREATSAGVLAILGSSVHADRTLVERTAGDASGAFGLGAEVQLASELVLTMSALIENRDVALFAMHAGTRVSISDSLIARTLPQASDGAFGGGVAIEEGATLALQASALVENRDAALFARHAGTVVTVTESLLARTLPQESDPEDGRGADVHDGAALDLQTSALLDNHDVTLLATGAGTSVSVSESLLARTQPRQSDLMNGRGVEVITGATLALRASALLDHRDVALFAAYSDTSITATESLVARTLPRERDSSYGSAAMCSTQAHLDLHASAIFESATAAVIFGVDCSGRVASSLVEHVAEGRFHEYQCSRGATPPCPGMEVMVATHEGLADGLVVGLGSTVDVEHTRLAEAPRAAVLYHESDGSLRGVYAKGGRFGLVLQGEPRPAWQDETNLFEGGEQPIVSDGNLPIPAAPPLPQE